MSDSVVQALLELKQLGATTTALGACSSVQPLWWSIFFWYSTWPSPDCVKMCLIMAGLGLKFSFPYFYPDKYFLRYTCLVLPFTGSIYLSPEFFIYFCSSPDTSSLSNLPPCFPADLKKSLNGTVTSWLYPKCIWYPTICNVGHKPIWGIYQVWYTVSILIQLWNIQPSSKWNEAHVNDCANVSMEARFIP